MYDRTGLVRQLRQVLHGVQRFGLPGDRDGSANARRARPAGLLHGVHVVPDGLPDSRLHQVRDERFSFSFS